MGIHDDGVGTSSKTLFAILGGAFGYGLAKNVCELYAWLVQNYKGPSDRIYLFGFSRGAFTVRCLAGMIAHNGIVTGGTAIEQKTRVKEAWASYKKSQRHFLRGAQPRDAGSVDIHFVGVWDTVDAYGFPIDEVKEGIARATQALAWLGPLRQFAWTRFNDSVPSAIIKNAYHAMALDDERHTFHPVLWDESKKQGDQQIEQVWFTGVHSDVGGGYPRDSLSFVPLLWMMVKARDCGLGFAREKWEDIEEYANNLGPAHDSRRGLAVYYRYRPRDVAVLCGAAHIDRAKVHSSVLDRIRRSNGAYCPQGLPPAFEVESTGVDLTDDDHSMRPDARLVEQVEAVHWWRARLYWCLVIWTILLVFLPKMLGGRSDGWPEPEWSFFGLSHVISMLQDGSPDFMGDWISTLRKEPFWVLLFGVVLVAMAGARVRLVSLNRSVAKAAWWLPGVAKNGPLDRALLSLGAAFAKVTRIPAKWWQRWMPVVVQFGVFAGIIVLIYSAIMGDRILPAQHRSDAPVGVSSLESESLSFRTANPAQSTEMLLEKGKSYKIVITDVEGWKGATLKASPEKGLEDSATMGMKALSVFKRDRSEEWFVLLGSIGSPNGKRFRVETGKEFVADRTGKLFLFVNDVTSYFTPDGPWVFYDNNDGTAKIEISRVP